MFRLIAAAAAVLDKSTTVIRDQPQCCPGWMSQLLCGWTSQLSVTFRLIAAAAVLDKTTTVIRDQPQCCPGVDGVDKSTNKAALNV
jgi:hypothetical protein